MIFQDIRDLHSIILQHIRDLHSTLITTHARPPFYNYFNTSATFILLVHYFNTHPRPWFNITTTQASHTCHAAIDPVELMDTSMHTLWETLDEAGEVVSCQNINGLYRSAVWDELCSELPGVLLVLLVSCVLLSTMLLLLVRCCRC